MTASVILPRLSGRYGLPSVGQNINVVTFFSIGHMVLHSKFLAISKITDVGKPSTVRWTAN